MRMAAVPLPVTVLAPLDIIVDCFSQLILLTISVGIYSLPLYAICNETAASLSGGLMSKPQRGFIHAEGGVLDRGRSVSFHRGC